MWKTFLGNKSFGQEKWDRQLSFVFTFYSQLIVTNKGNPFWSLFDLSGNISVFVRNVLVQFILVTTLPLPPLVSFATTWNTWRHQMEEFSALLVLCAGNSQITGEFPHKGQWRRTLMFSLICAWIRLSKPPWLRWFETPLCSLWRH